MIYFLFKRIYEPITEEDKQDIEDYKRTLLNKYEFFSEVCEKNRFLKELKNIYQEKNFLLADVFINLCF